jgi:hypothetical protein
MNVTVLNKIEAYWVKLDWKDYIERVHFKKSDLETMVDLIDNFKGNRRVKELVVFKYRRLPAYAVIAKSEYTELLDWVYDKFIQMELYENCQRILELKSKLCTNLKKS